MLRKDSASVQISVSPEVVWDFVSDLNNWKEFSDFGKNLEQINDSQWVAHTSQGDVVVVPSFNKHKLVLDHLCIMPDGDEILVPYYILPSDTGSQLTMVNQQGQSVSNEEYDEQLSWMNEELKSIKAILEQR